MQGNQLSMKQFLIPLITRLYLLYYKSVIYLCTPLCYKQSFAVVQMSRTLLWTSFCHFGLSLLHDTWLTSPQFAGKSPDTK